MELHNSEEVLEIKNALLFDFYPENLQNSKFLPYLTEHLSFKISDFSFIYRYQDIESLNLLKKCNFLNINEEIAEYDEKQINCIFICEENILDEDMIKALRYLKNVKYERFYRKNNYKWIFVPELESKENFVNFIKQNNIKMFNLKKSSIINNINYQKESFGLKDKRKNSDYNNNSNQKWRKYSKNYIPHKNSIHNNNYYKAYKGRERFNSDGYNYTKNGSNYHNPIKKIEKIEVELSEIKYPLIINYKYSINNLKDIYQKLKKENSFNIKPSYLVEENEIISNRPKDIDIFNTSLNFIKKAQASKNEDLGEDNERKMKIPKYNPLCQMKKNFNKFDPIPHDNNILIK